MKKEEEQTTEAAIGKICDARGASLKKEVRKMQTYQRA